MKKITLEEQDIDEVINSFIEEYCAHQNNEKDEFKSQIMRHVPFFLCCLWAGMKVKEKEHVRQIKGFMQLIEQKICELDYFDQIKGCVDDFILSSTQRTIEEIESAMTEFKKKLSGVKSDINGLKKENAKVHKRLKESYNENRRLRKELEEQRKLVNSVAKKAEEEALVEAVRTHLEKNKKKIAEDRSAIKKQLDRFIKDNKIVLPDDLQDLLERFDDADFLQEQQGTTIVNNIQNATFNAGSTMNGDVINKKGE